MTDHIRIASRESRLAVIQSEIMAEEIKRAFPGIDTEIITFKTTGDIILDKSLESIGGKGLFVKELDMALLRGDADVSVHSLKDMPMECNPVLPVIAYSRRADPFDALVLPKGKDSIDFSKPVGCSSKRRSIQLGLLCSDIEVKAVRGNVLTRLEKLDRGEYSALVLAAAGLERLGLENRISHLFTAEEMLPAAGQGIIALQCRQGFEWLGAVNDRSSEICAGAERAFIKRLDGGCSSPAAAFCTIEGDSILLRGLNVKDGQIIKSEIRADKDEYERAGILLAERLM